MAEKNRTFANGIYVRQQDFDNGSHLLRVRIDVVQFQNFLQEHASNGFVNLDIQARKSPSENGLTHFIVLNTWKPSKEQATTEIAEETKVKKTTKKKATSKNKEDVPF